MNNKQLYEIQSIADGHTPHVVMSRYADGNDDLNSPDFSVTISSSLNDGNYDTTSAPEDVDGDGDTDAEDESYYTVAAKLVCALITLSSVGELKVFDRLLLMNKDANNTDVSILHFKPGNRSIHLPDFTVTATGVDALGRYLEIKQTIDADGDGDIDKDDELIYRRIASSFASMRDLLP
ncbi:hypothetical protein CS078_00185 [Pseudomonas prosekii]|uniref:Uncharacterized protein n=1 Tax=Pseudomonas prosekii TaxID=1148509 RepID=A0A3L8CPT7_9PSED|nr:hypothetical protein [Pseudomonas prosekii]RLU09868.1 hypothetical protein CS076_13080 [Pseudomonas prosekii]RLU12157.1 hypothetical protein CS078_00185 [Pseudomonas prosekii]